MATCYQSAVLSAPGLIDITTLAVPRPGPREVVVRMEGCGICGSSLPVWEGREWFHYPQAPGNPGHEGWGRVEETGAEVAGLHPGDRVAMLSYHAFAEMDKAEAEQVLKLPASLDDQPFPGEALGCAMNAFKRSDIQSHHRVAVIGVGFMGALLVQMAAMTGATVYAYSKRPFSLEIARTMGAAAAYPLDDHWKIVAHVKELTDGKMFDRVIEATGYPWPLDLAGELTGERGRLIIAGYHQDGVRQVNMQLWNWKGLDVINAHERDPAVYLEGMRGALAEMEAGRLDPSPLYTHRYRLDELSDGLSVLGNRDDEFLKGLLIL